MTPSSRGRPWPRPARRRAAPRASAGHRPGRRRRARSTVGTREPCGPRLARRPSALRRSAPCRPVCRHPRGCRPTSPARSVSAAFRTPWGWTHWSRTRWSRAPGTPCLRAGLVGAVLSRARLRGIRLRGGGGARRRGRRRRGLVLVVPAASARSPRRPAGRARRPTIACSLAVPCPASCWLLFCLDA